MPTAILDETDHYRNLGQQSAESAVLEPRRGETFAPSRPPQATTRVRQDIENLTGIGLPVVAAPAPAVEVVLTGNEQARGYRKIALAVMLHGTGAAEFAAATAAASDLLIESAAANYHKALAGMPEISELRRLESNLAKLQAEVKDSEEKRATLASKIQDAEDDGRIVQQDIGKLNQSDVLLTYLRVALDAAECKREFGQRAALRAERTLASEHRGQTWASCLARKAELLDQIGTYLKTMLAKVAGQDAIEAEAASW